MSNCSWCGDEMKESVLHICIEPQEYVCTICKSRPTDVVGCINSTRVNDMPTECLFCCGCSGDCKEYWGSLCCVKDFGESDTEAEPHIVDFKPDCLCCINKCPNCSEEW